MTRVIFPLSIADPSLPISSLVKPLKMRIGVSRWIEAEMDLLDTIGL